jgi:transposase-like protein
MGSVRKHGIAPSGLQRYFCISCKRTFQVSYIYPQHETHIIQQVKSLLDDAKSRDDISKILGIEPKAIDRYILMMSLSEI